MYICICNSLTERDVRDAIDESRAGSPEEVLRYLRGTPKCGVCRSFIAQLLGQDPDQDEDFPSGGFGPG